MGIERGTPHPAFYASEQEAWKERARGKFYFLLPIATRRKLSSVRLTTRGRWQAAQIIACITGKRPVFNQQASCYQVSGWSGGSLSCEVLNRALLVIQRIILYGTGARQAAEMRALVTSA